LVAEIQQIIGRRLFFWGIIQCCVRGIEQNIIATSRRRVAVSQ
jgi:hypothetical protein